MKRRSHWRVMCLMICFLLFFSSCEVMNVSGVSDARINEKGELILIYQNGRGQNLGVVVGEDGSNGANGADGVLETGDVIVRVAINGTATEIKRQYHVIDMMLDVRVGDVVSLEILRDGEEKTVHITVTEDCLTAY